VTTSQLGTVWIAWLLGCSPQPHATPAAGSMAPPANAIDAGAPPLAARHPEVLLHAAAIASPRREIADLVAQRECEARKRPEPCWGDEGKRPFAWPPDGAPLSPRFEARQVGRSEWEVRAGGGSWRFAVDVAASAGAAWVEKEGERWVFAGAQPSTDIIFVASERTVAWLFLLEDDKAATSLSVRTTARGPQLRLHELPVLDAKHEARAPKVAQEPDRVHIAFDPTGLTYPLLAAIQLELVVPDPTPPPQPVAWRLALGASPGPRTEPAMAYDSQRRRVVLFGGRNLDDTVWERDASGWHATSPVGSPWQRLGLPAAFDAARGRTVLFGGQNFAGGHANDTWTWDGTALVRVLPARSPPGRYWASMAYDAARARVVMLGGTGSEGHPDSCQYDCDGTWEWDGANWTRFDPSPAPSPRFGAAMTYDPVRKRVLAFGGASYTGDCTLAGCNDTWEWDGTTWTKRNPKTSPSRRSFAGLAWDTTRRRAVLFGGGTNAGGTDVSPFGDTWEWDGAEWARMTPRRAPSPRTEHCIVYDEARRRVVLYGGNDAGDTEEWEYDGTSWTPILQPRATVDAAMAYDPASKRVLLFGGELFAAPSVLSDDTWLWGGARWERAPGPHPRARRYAALAGDLARKRVVLFGGGCDAGNTVICGDTWLWDGTRWTEAHPRVSPTPRQNHAMAYDEKRQRVVLYGGTAAGAFANGTWEWDGTSWTRSDPSPSPGNREGHAMAYDARRGKVVLYGGSGTSSPACGGECADTWEWDGRTWSKIGDVASTPARRFATLAYDRMLERVLLSGGTGRGCPHFLCNDILQWDGAAWSRLDLFPTPGPRRQHAMAWDDARGEMVVYGGVGADTLAEDTWVLGRR
jgi:hypothetical protein